MELGEESVRILAREDGRKASGVFRMAQVNPRTLPIALVLAGAIIMSVVVSAYAYGQRVDTFLTAIVVIAFLIGVIAILLGAYLYYWERSEYYKHVI
jgi:predicted lysophospholipase L1 biosynthesis ABC-type transport system permease subunit